VEVPTKGPIRTEPLSISVRRDLRKLRGLFQDLLMGADGGSKDDYLFVELLDRHPVLDSMARLRQIYPNLLGIESANEREVDPGVLTLDHRSLDPETLFSRFFLEATGEDLSPEEMAMYREISTKLAQERNS
jgi:exonuclease SbcD